MGTSWGCLRTVWWRNKGLTAPARTSRSSKTSTTSFSLPHQSRHPLLHFVHHRLQLRIRIRPQVYEPSVVLHGLLPVTALLVQLAQPFERQPVVRVEAGR